MKQTTWFPGLALLAAAVAAAVPALGEEIDHDRRYRTCLALAGVDPEAATARAARANLEKMELTPPAD